MEGKRLTAGKSVGISNNNLSKRRQRHWQMGRKERPDFTDTSEVESTGFVLGYGYGIDYGKLLRSSI